MKIKLAKNVRDIGKIVNMEKIKMFVDADERTYFSCMDTQIDKKMRLAPGSMYLFICIFSAVQCTLYSIGWANIQYCTFSETSTIVAGSFFSLFKISLCRVCNNSPCMMS